MSNVSKLKELERRIGELRSEQVELLASYRQALARHMTDITAEIASLTVAAKPEAPDFGLTEREKMVIRCLIHGIVRGDAIGEALGISERTVRTHLTNIYQKTRIPNKAELAVRFKEWWS